jgi:hypothetical protein
MSAINPQDLMRTVQQFAQATGQSQPQAEMSPPMVAQSQPPSRASENPMLTNMMPPASTDVMMAMPAAVPSVGPPSMMPASFGIGSLPMQDQQPMSVEMMLAGMSPNQSEMVNEYLRSRNMVGFV